MSKSRFVRPDLVTLAISNGDSLLVKKRLTWGEERASFERMCRAGTTDVLPLETGMGLVTSYLIDWTLTDEEGKKVEIRGKSIDELSTILDLLDPDDFREIKLAIQGHDERMQTQRAAEKNGQAGESDAAPISPLRSAVAGGSNGSATSTAMIT